MKNKQTINCNVCSCKYNDEINCMCNLADIKVSCSCNKDDCTCKKETICENFQAKK